MFSEKVLSWFDLHGRHSLPWQIDPTPYRVWISEVMLQQTQVTTVIDYFNRFISRFPTIKHLAEAHQDDVLSLWSGLGYYSRARNLHKCAQIIHKQYHGQWPMDVPTLETLPGIGRSTAGAIISLSNNYFAPILDGNVKRVLARFFALPYWPGESKMQKLLWEKAEMLTSQQRTRDYNQAMMDLGATICTRTKPRCTTCPLQEECLAYREEKEQQLSPGQLALTYPKKKPKAAIPVIHKRFLLMVSPEQQQIWLYKRPPTGIWGGLWSLPEFDMDENVEEWVLRQGFDPSMNQIALPVRKHVFSHFILHLHPILIVVHNPSLAHLKRSNASANVIREKNESGWHTFGTPWPGGLSAPIAKLIEEACQQLVHH